MSNTIDERIVSMQFDNAQFESGVKESMGTLSRLNSVLEMTDGTKGMNALSGAIGRIDLTSVGIAAEALTSKFSILGTIGDQAIRNLTNTTMGFFRKLSSATIGQIKSGGIARAMNLEKAQFQIEGLVKETGAWEKALDDINYAVQDTAYGLDEAAVVASQLIASSVQFGDEMKYSLRAVSGVAAMTGSSYSDIGRIFTTVAGNGRLMGDQLNQLSARGINAAAILGEQLGKSEAEIRKLVSSGKISFSEFAKAMDDAFGEHAKAANETFTGALSNVKSALSRIGADVATPGLKELRDVFNSLRPVINEVRKALQFVVTDVNKGVARISKWLQDLFNGVDSKQLTFILHDLWRVAKNVFGGIKSIIDPIKAAFSELFPRDTTKQLSDLTRNLSLATKELKLSEEAAEGLKNITKLLLTPIKAFAEVLKLVWGFAAPVGRAILSLANNFLLAFTNTTSAGEALNKLSNIIVSAINGVANGTNILGKYIHDIQNYLRSFAQHISQSLSFDKIFSSITDGLGNAYSVIKSIFSGIYTIVIDTLEGIRKGMNFNTVAGLGIVGFITSILSSINNLTLSAKDSFTQITRAFTRIPLNVQDVIIKVKTIANTLNTSLVAFQQNIKADILQKIAKSVLMLAASMFIIATIPHDKIVMALGAVTALVYEMVKTFESLMKMIDGLNLKGFDVGVLGLMGPVLISFAASILILAFALKTISSVSWEGLAKGIIGIAVLCKTMTMVASNLSSLKNVGSGISKLLFFAATIAILSKVVKDLGSVKAEELVKGLLSVGALIGGLMIFINLTNKKIDFGSGLALIALAGAIKILTSSVEKLGGLSIDTLVIGLASVGALLVGLILFINLINKQLNVGTGIALLALAGTMSILTNSLLKLSDLSWEQLGIALTGMLVGMLTLVAVVALLGVLENAKLKGNVTPILVVALVSSILADTLNKIGALNWDQLNVALSGLLIGMLTLVAVVALLGVLENAKLKGNVTPILVVALVSSILADTLIKIGVLNWEQLGVALVGMLGALAILVSVYAILGALKNANLSASLPSIIGLMLVATAMNIAIKPIIAMGDVSWDQIGKALVSMVAVLTIIIAACAIMGQIGVVGLAGAGILLVASIALSLALSAIIGSIAAITNVVKTIETMDPDAVRENLKAIADGFGEFGKSLKNFGITSPIGALAMIEIAGAIAILAPALKQLESIKDPKKVQDVLSTIGVGFESFTTAINKSGILSGFQASGFVKIAEAISIFAPAIALLSNSVDPNDLSTTLNAVATAFVTFGEAISKAPLFGSVSRAEGIGVLIDNIDALATSLPHFANSLNGLDLYTTLSAVGNAFKMFGDALNNTPLLGASARGEGIAYLVNSVGELAKALPDFAIAIDGVDFATVFRTLGDAYKTLGSSLSNAPVIGAASRGQAVSTLVDSITNLKNGIEYFSQLSPETVSSVMGSIGSAFKQLGTALINTPVLGPSDRSAALITMVDGINNLTDSIKYFLTIAPEEAQNALITIGDAFNSFGTAIKQTPFWGVTDRAGGIMALVDGIGALVPSLEKLENLDGATTSQNLDILGNTFASFGEAIKKSPFWGVENRAGALVSLVGAIDVLIPCIEKLAAMGAQNVQSAIGHINTALDTLGISLTNFGGNKKQADLLKDVSSAFGAFTPIIIGLDGAITEGLSTKIISFSAAISAFLKSLEGFDAVISKLQNVCQLMFEIGENAIQGLIDGLRSKRDELKATANDIADLVVRGVAEPLEIHSPSRVLMSMGQDSVRGFLIGFSDNEEVISIANKFGYDTMDALAEGLEKGEVGADLALTTIMDKIKLVMGTEADLEDLIKNFQDYPEEFDSFINKYKDSLKDANEESDDLEESSKKASDAIGGSGGLGSSAKSAGKEIDKLTDITDYAMDVVVAYGEKVGLLNESMGDTLPENFEIAKTAVMDFATRLYEAKVKSGELEFIPDDEVDATSKRLAAIKENFLDMYNGLEKSISGQMDIFSEFNKKSELTADDLLNNLKSQISGVSEWSGMLVTLAERGIDDGLLQKLGELGPQGYEKVKAFTTMTADQLAEYNSLYAQSLELPKSAATNIVAGWAAAGNQMGSDLERGLQNGLNKQRDNTIDIIRTQGEDYLSEYQTSLHEHSPSTATEEMGVNLLLGLKKGIENPKTLVLLYKAITVICESVLKRFEKYINEEAGYKLAELYMEGFSRGIDESSDSILKQIESIAEKINNAMAGGLGEASPSKITYGFGRYYMLGLANGIADNVDSPIDSANHAALMLSDVIQTIADTVDDDIDLSPVITPIVDLDNVRAGAEKMNQLMGYNSNSYRLAASSRGSTQLQNTPDSASAVGTQVYNFNQYNNSPKALSRIDIYRQTKSQFAMFKGATKR